MFKIRLLSYEGFSNEILMNLLVIKIQELFQSNYEKLLIF